MTETNRHTDTDRPPHAGKPLPLAIMDWTRIRHSAPAPVSNFGFYTSFNGPLATWAAMTAM